MAGEIHKNSKWNACSRLGKSAYLYIMHGAQRYTQVWDCLPMAINEWVTTTGDDDDDVVQHKRNHELRQREEKKATTFFLVSNWMDARVPLIVLQFLYLYFIIGRRGVYD